MAGESEKEGFAFPRTKTFITRRRCSQLSLRPCRFLFDTQSSFTSVLFSFSIFLPCSTSSFTFSSFFYSNVAFCRLLALISSLSLFLICWSYSSSSRFFAVCSLVSWVHSSSSLARLLFSISRFLSSSLVPPFCLFILLAG